MITVRPASASSPPIPRVGSTDPRVDRTRRAVMAAVSELLAEEGAAAVSHQRVAERAGVGRATLYRHWPKATDLLYDGLAEVEEPLLRHADGPLVPWLRIELRRAAIEMAQPNSVQLLAVLVSRAQAHAAAGRLRDALMARTVAPLADALTQALATGELASAPDPLEVLAQLLGPLLFRVSIGGSPATDEFIDRVIDQVLAPWLAAPPAPPARANGHRARG